MLVRMFTLSTWVNPTILYERIIILSCPLDYGIIPHDGRYNSAPTIGALVTVWLDGGLSRSGMMCCIMGAGLAPA